MTGRRCEGHDLPFLCPVRSLWEAPVRNPSIWVYYCHGNIGGIHGTLELSRVYW